MVIRPYTFAIPPTGIFHRNSLFGQRKHSKIGFRVEGVGGRTLRRCETNSTCLCFAYTRTKILKSPKFQNCCPNPQNAHPQILADFLNFSEFGAKSGSKIRGVTQRRTKDSVFHTHPKFACMHMFCLYMGKIPKTPKHEPLIAWASKRTKKVDHVS